MSAATTSRFTSRAQEVVLGGGNLKKLARLPPLTRGGDDANAFRRGVLMWRPRLPTVRRTAI
jgi:hypothetical protein